MPNSISQEKKVSVIIPAYNEEQTVAGVVRVARAHKAVGEVIVVDDGSSDQTAKLAAQVGARVHKTLENQGKGEAMRQGVGLANYGYICFLDADIRGFSQEALERIIRPVLSGDCQMYVAIRDRRARTLNKLLHFFPILGGERALVKSLWYRVPKKYKKNFQIEIALNYFAKKNGYKMGFEVIPRLTQVIKEKKRGPLLGFWQRLKMAGDILMVSWQLYIVESLLKGDFRIFVPSIKVKRLVRR